MGAGACAPSQGPEGQLGACPLLWEPGRKGVCVCVCGVKPEPTLCWNNQPGDFFAGPQNLQPASLPTLGMKRGNIMFGDNIGMLDYPWQSQDCDGASLHALITLCVEGCHVLYVGLPSKASLKWQPVLSVGA